MGNVIVIFGSAATGCYRYGEAMPHDIDVITTYSEPETAEAVNAWSLKRFGEVLPIDSHTPEYQEGKLLIPALNADSNSHIFLRGNLPVEINVRENGFASFLRLYGSDVDKFLEVMESNTQHLSMLPPEYSYYSTIANQDKYYSGLRAFRNAAAHASDLDAILDNLNCGKLLRMLLTKDPVNWMSSPDLTGKIFSHGEGWSHAVTLHISSDLSDPVLRGSENKNEAEAIEILFS